ncbi:Ribosomal protein S35- mitochondrial [Apiospora hydei]|uniref:Ribosomal protein S35- mitochondrial n=1 Tax=Apiospora hydei TaxID=1337664 RepID=A0ABR1VI56_9PEZI
MPPRIPTKSSASSASALVRSSFVSPCTSQCLPSCRAGFSTTPSRERSTNLRRAFLQWTRTIGANYRQPKPEGGPNYLQSFGVGPNKPFPLNPQFRSERVLDEQARELIWEKVMRRGETLKAVSAELGVDLTRVAAVVRLKEVEKDWISKGKKLATPYSKAVLGMLPTKSFRPGVQNQPLEPINELHIHTATQKQLFWPTAESRQFTREDAAKAFHAKMLSADKRVPHPELIQMEKDLLKGMSPDEARARFINAAEQSERKAAEKQQKKAMAEEQATKKVNTPRFEFRFKEVDSELIGKDGRAPNVVGWKYGMPHYDRKKGLVKIPTSVP